MDEIANKAKGLRKAGLGITAMTCIACWKDLSLEKAGIIAVIAIVAITCQCILDWREDADSYRNRTKEK